MQELESLRGFVDWLHSFIFDFRWSASSTVDLEVHQGEDNGVDDGFVTSMMAFLKKNMWTRAR